MGSDAMKTGISIWKGLIFSISNCCGAIRDHLFVLGTMFLLFLLYRFVPALFGFLVSSLPLLVCTAVLLKTLLSLGNDPIKNATEEENRVHKISFQKERSVRKIRGAKSKYEDGDVMIEDKPRNNWNHSDKIMDSESSTSRSYPTGSSFYDDLVVNNNRKLEKMNLLLDSEPSQAALLFPIDDVPALERYREFKVESGDLEAESQEEAEDEDEGKGGQDDGTKVLAWTEDDQKNLMDLGTSEIERNKRLENLIAKRRARKNLRLLAEKNLIELDSNDPPGQIAPISMVKGNPFDLPQNFNETKDLLLPSPGSAPSILLPTRNPFDLPYDSLEERPNLMGDSFQQEFMAEQKDISFCRHESFSFGPSLLGELKQDGHRARLIPYFVTDQILSNRTAYPETFGLCRSGIS